MPEISGIIQNYLRGSIESLGGEPPVIESKTITENGTYTAPSGVDGYSPIEVAVPTPEPVINPISIFANETYTAPEGVDGFNPVVVDVPSKEEITLYANQNETYTPDEGRVYNNVVVNVPVNCNMYSSNDDKLRLYENVFNALSILTLNGLYINQTISFDDIDNEHIKEVLSNLTVIPFSQVFNSKSQTISSNQLGIDPLARLMRYYNNNLGSYDVGNVYGSIILINTNIIASEYAIQLCPNIP